MLSRVADSLYWMSRYLERAENTVRLLDVTMGLMLDPGGANAEDRWQRMTAALGKPAGLEWNGSLEAMARKLVFDHLDPCLRHLLHQRRARKCPPGARRNLHRAVAAPQSPLSPHSLAHAQAQFAASASDMLASVVDGIHLFQGVGDSTMIHGQGWQFIRLGRSLERAYATATLLEVYRSELFQAHERESSAISIWSSSACCAAARPLRPIARSTLPISRPNAFLSSLFSIAIFPHAIRYCVDNIRTAIESIQRTGGRRSPDELFAGVGKLHAMLGYTTIDEILAGDAAAFLHNIREQCLRIHELVYRNYVQYSIQSALAV